MTVENYTMKVPAKISGFFGGITARVLGLLFLYFPASVAWDLWHSYNSDAFILPIGRVGLAVLVGTLALVFLSPSRTNKLFRSRTSYFGSFVIRIILLFFMLLSLVLVLYVEKYTQLGAISFGPEAPKPLLWSISIWIMLFGAAYIAPGHYIRLLWIRHETAKIYLREFEKIAGVISKADNTANLQDFNNVVEQALNAQKGTTKRGFDSILAVKADNIPKWLYVFFIPPLLLGLVGLVGFLKGDFVVNSILLPYISISMLVAGLYVLILNIYYTIALKTRSRMGLLNSQTKRAVFQILLSVIGVVYLTPVAILRGAPLLHSYYSEDSWSGQEEFVFVEHKSVDFRDPFCKFRFVIYRKFDIEKTPVSVCNTLISQSDVSAGQTLLLSGLQTRFGIQYNDIEILK